MNRRSLITGLASLIAAPAIVKASSLMPIRGELWWSGGLVMPTRPQITIHDQGGRWLQMSYGVDFATGKTHWSVWDGQTKRLLYSGPAYTAVESHVAAIEAHAALQNTIIV